MIKRLRYRSKIDKNKNLFIKTYRKNIPWMRGRTPNWIKQFVRL
jgi:hypothetical protein